MADIFTWDIDIEKDIHQGDTFKILYEERSRKGQAKSALRILAAELINAGQKLTAIYFEKQHGEGNYYNLEGQSLARSFLRFPLEFTSITSHFTESRFHPILKTNLPHTGVDFAAQRGTPVRAVGDGVIAEAGWNGSYGKAIDITHDTTYMGLERITAVLQNVLSNYDIDYMRALTRTTERIAGKKYGVDPQADISFRVIDDHARAVSFLIADGVMPSNEGRGYVLRRLLRRAARHGRLLDLKEPFLHEVTKTVAEVMGDAYPDVRAEEQRIREVIRTEEERFVETLEKGTLIIQDYLQAHES